MVAVDHLALSWLLISSLTSSRVIGSMTRAHVSVCFLLVVESVFFFGTLSQSAILFFFKFKLSITSALHAVILIADANYRLFVWSVRDLVSRKDYCCTPLDCARPANLT